jgi:glycosyltransferase involved in cell wall biosynthesis
MSRFVFIVPMFNASETLTRMLHSVCGQSHEDWQIIIIDDVSDLQERRACESVIHSFNKLCGSTIISIWNEEKRWEVANVLEGLKLCRSDDIVCRLDADDWLTDLDALAIIDSVYASTGCDALWTAHRWGFSDKNISGPLPDDADPYTHPWVTSHLKTFRKSLIEGVDDVNFRGADGGYVRRAGDQAIYLPVLNGAKRRIFLPRVTYHYNIPLDKPEIFSSADAVMQKREAEFIRSRGFVK